MFRKRVWAMTAAGFLCVTVASPADGNAVCDLVLADEQIERDALELELDFARTEYSAYEEIFILLEGLWKIGGLEELTYLEGKHDRDSARSNVGRLEAQLARQDVFLERLDFACRVKGSREDSGRTTRTLTLDYTRAECARLRHEVDLGEIDVEFELAWLASMVELREFEVAAKQDIILAEFKIETARKRRAQARKWLASCLETLERLAPRAEN